MSDILPIVLLLAGLVFFVFMLVVWSQERKP